MCICTSVDLQSAVCCALTVDDDVILYSKECEGL